MNYRTLVVAPKTDLSLAEDEIFAVVNALHANILRGVVTAKMVLDEISKGWDIVWFMTHGTADGILLSDGLLSASSLTTFIRTSEARLVVLNTCKSIDVALKIHNELLTHLICTLSDVPDRDAFFTGKQLALHLARGKTFSQAYLDAKPGQNQDYIFLVGKDRNQTSMALSTLPASRPTNAKDYAESIRRLEELVRGDTSWGQEGLVDTVREMNGKINRMEKSILILQVELGFLLVTTLIMIAIAIYLSRGI